MTPTNSPGFKVELSTSPGIGKKTVFLVLVLTTTHLSSGFYSGSMSSSTYGSISKISTTLLTSQGSCLFCLILLRLSCSYYWTLIIGYDYFFHVRINFVHFKFVLFDVIVEHSNSIFYLFICQVCQLSSDFIEVWTCCTFSHLDFKFFLNYKSKSVFDIFYKLLFLILIGHGTFTRRNLTKHR